MASKHHTAWAAHTPKSVPHVPQEIQDTVRWAIETVVGGAPDGSFNWFQMTTVSRCPQVLQKREFAFPREQSQWVRVYVFGVVMYVFGTNG